MRKVKIKPFPYIFLMATIAFATAPITVHGQARSSVFINPANNTFYTNIAHTGTNFTVNVTTANWESPGVFGYEFKVTFDPTQLEAVAAEIPTGHWLTPTIKPGNIFIVDSGTIDLTAGTISFAATLLSPEVGKTGGGTLAVITFKIVATAPTSGNVSSAIGLKDVILVDPNATPIPTSDYDVIDGQFTFAMAAGIPGDLNGDGKINISDLAIWGLAFDSTPSSQRWNPAADLNNDGIVNIRDAVLIAMNWTG